VISYFTKMYQAVPALMQLYRGLGGTFVSTRGSTVRAIRKVYPEALVEPLHERLGRFSAGDRCMRQAGLIVTGSPNRHFLAKYSAPKCMVFHGTYAFMAQQEIDGLQHFDLICAIGPRMQEALAHTGLESRLIDSGYLPFMEFPERNAIDRQHFLQKLGLNPENKTLLYLPRGKPYGSWDVMAEKLIRQIPPHYNLILRPHPSQSVTARIRDKLGFMQLSRLSRERTNAFLDLTACKLSTLFSVADLVISDGASSPEESLYYDLPQVFVESQGSSPTAIGAMMRDKKLPENYIEKLLTIYECGRRITPEEPDILTTVESALAESQYYRPYREAYFAWVFGARDLTRQRNLMSSLKQYSTN
jgi:CDP-glycerol glycerophosphotransferase (TagB/SpsB family)